MAPIFQYNHFLAILCCPEYNPLFVVKRLKAARVRERRCTYDVQRNRAPSYHYKES